MALMKSLSFSFGRKRILICDERKIVEEFCDDFECKSPVKRRKEEEEEERENEAVISRLEALPKEILIKIICGVEHDDLKQLFHVSRTIREATLIVKESHFAYRTPTKTRAFHNPFDLDNEIEDYKAQNAPRKMKRRENRLPLKKLEDISVALFASENDDAGDDHWRKKKSSSMVKVDFSEL